MKVWRSTFVFHCFSSVFWYAWHGNQQTHCLGRSSVRPQRWHYYRVCFPWGGWLEDNVDIILVTSDYEHLPICCSILFFSIFTQDRLVLTSNGQGSGSPQVIGYDAPIAQQHPILGCNSCHTVHTLGCPTHIWVFGMYPAFSKFL